MAFTLAAHPGDVTLLIKMELQRSVQCKRDMLMMVEGISFPLGAFGSSERRTMGDEEATDVAGNGGEGAILCVSMENVHVGLRSTDLRALRTNRFWRWISWAWGQ
ncbi:hypothetical protein CY35_01G005000 [Sphagnum magellanicum]|nr:hypothetical protein CY35_01G005000 [Sphagnum magellanicum]